MHFRRQGSYSPLAAYARSKLAQVLFGAEMRRRLRRSDPRIQVFSLHPGEWHSD